MSTLKTIAALFAAVCVLACAALAAGFTAGAVYQALHGAEMQPVQIPAVTGKITGVKK